MSATPSELAPSEVLMAASGCIQHKCQSVNAALMKCKAESGPNPNACLKQGTAVRACVDELLSVCLLFCVFLFSILEMFLFFAFSCLHFCEIRSNSERNRVERENELIRREAILSLLLFSCCCNDVWMMMMQVASHSQQLPAQF